MTAGDIELLRRAWDAYARVAFIHRSPADGVSAEALDFHDAGDRVVVAVQTHQPPDWGDQPEAHD